MKRTRNSSTHTAALALAAGLLAVSCSRSGQVQLAKAQPKSLVQHQAKTTIAPVFEDAAGEVSTQKKALLMTTETPDGTVEPAASALESTASLSTREIVRAEMSKSAAFINRSEAEKAKIERLLTKQAEKAIEKQTLAAKKNPAAVTAAPAAPLGIDKTVTIGLIVLGAGIILGLVAGTLGWIVTVAGICIIAYGLIMQV